MTEIADSPGLYFPEFPPDFTVSALNGARPQTLQALGMVLDELWDSLPVEHRDGVAVDFADADVENPAGSMEVYCEAVSTRRGDPFESAVMAVTCEPNFDFVWPCCGEKSPISNGQLAARLIAQRAAKNPSEALWLMQAYDLASDEPETDIGAVRRMIMRSPIAPDCFDVQECNLFFNNGATLRGKQTVPETSMFWDVVPPDFRWLHLRLTDHPGKTDYEYACYRNGKQVLRVLDRNLIPRPESVQDDSGQKAAEPLDRRSIVLCEWNMQRFARALCAALRSGSEPVGTA